MSFTTIYKVEQNGKLYHATELMDAQGSAPLVWSVISHKILGDKNLWLSHITQARKVWNYWKDPSCTEAEAFAILFTFDKALIEGDRLNKASNLFKQFLSEHPIKYDLPNNLPLIAEYCEKYSEEELMGLCFHQNSLSPNPWINEDTEENYDFSTGTEHFGVFTSLGKKEFSPPTAPDKGIFEKR